MKKKHIIAFFFPLGLLLVLLAFTPGMGDTKEAKEADAKAGFIGGETCKDCHEEQYKSYSKTAHFQKSVKGPQSQDACETCHGAAKDHPASGKLPIPTDVVALCTLCHEAMPGRPQTQPQVVVAEHGGGQPCGTCHNAHSPRISAVTGKVQGDIAAGRKRADAECASCHGARGLSPNDTWPSLAGQNAAYLVRIMSSYKSGAQQDAMMTPLAKALDEAAIRDVAVYYASLNCTEGGAAKATKADLQVGRALAKNCASCHGETGTGTNPAWPNFAGQRAEYLVNVLKAFRGGLRKDPMMAGVVRGLSDADINNLAAYYSAQTCQPAK
jgi:cytochrome c553